MLPPLQFVDHGTGPTVVLVHGFPLDGRIFEGVVAMLRDHIRVIVPDLHGFGRTASAELSMDSMAESVHDLVRSLDAAPCWLAGLSMGGYVAQQIAMRFPDDLNGLILIDTKCEADTDAQRTGREAMAALAREKGSEAVAEQMFPSMLGDAVGSTNPAAAARLREIMSSCRPQTIARACLAMRDRPDYTETLHTLGVPLTVIAGEHDRISPPAIAEHMSRLAPEGRLVTIRHAGHMAPLEQPHAVAAAILSAIDNPGGGT